MRTDNGAAPEIRLVPCFIPLQGHLIPLFPSHRSQPVRSACPRYRTRIQDESEKARHHCEGMGQAVGPWFTLTDEHAQWWSGVGRSGSDGEADTIQLRASIRQ